MSEIESDELNPEERDIARLLKAAGPREELPPPLMDKWQQHFRDELQAAARIRHRKKRRTVMGLCASVAIVAAAIALLYYSPSSPQRDIIVRNVSGDSSLHSGQKITVGSVVSTGSTGFIAITYGQYDLRLNSDTRVTLAADRIILQAGELYADNPGVVAAAQPLFIETPYNSVRDIGTQFSVALHPHSSVTTVREGTVVIGNGQRELHAVAPLDGALRVTVHSNQIVDREHVQASGAPWRWIYAGSIEFKLEGHSVYEFLEWSVTETGLHLEFASSGAEIYARTAVLHGSIGDLNPEQAVDPVLATTDLEAEQLDGGRLRVSLKERR